MHLRPRNPKDDRTTVFLHYCSLHYSSAHSGSKSHDSEIELPPKGAGPLIVQACSAQDHAQITVCTPNTAPTFLLHLRSAVREGDQGSGV